jgi:ubiquinone/menaquinone biosynthesis C-methylase UbiE
VDEPDFLHLTRTSYDTIAEAYGEHFRREPAANPWDRAVPGAFVELVTARSPGPVADVGCGTGRVTGHLHVRFTVDSMLALDLPDGSLGGLVAS